MTDPTTPDNRARVQLVDIVMMLSVLVALIVLAPVFMRFTDLIAASADPFTKLVLSFTVPFLILALILSVGVSARRGA